MIATFLSALPDIGGNVTQETKMTLTETLAALEAAETILRMLAPADEDFNRELFTVSENTRLSLAAHECYRIRVELMRYFNDPRNRQQEDSKE